MPILPDASFTGASPFSHKKTGFIATFSWYLENTFFCQKHLLDLKFKNTFYLVKRPAGAHARAVSTWCLQLGQRQGARQGQQDRSGGTAEAAGQEWWHRGGSRTGVVAPRGQQGPQQPCVTSRDTCPGAWGQPWAPAPPQLRACPALLAVTFFSGAQFLLFLALVSQPRAPDVGVNYSPTCLRALLPVIYLNSDKLYIPLVIHVKII